VIRYTCHHTLLPAVEGTLVAGGYRIETQEQYAAGRASTRVLTRGLTTVVLTADRAEATATIDIWGLGQASAAHILEAFSLEKRTHTPGQIMALGREPA